MRFRTGQLVLASDGAFGELTHVVVDPHRREVTHIIAEPDRDHGQARLIPIWLVSEGASSISISLDLKHLRQLQRVLETDFVRLGHSMRLAKGWDVDVLDMLAMPYWISDSSGGFLDEHQGFDARVPRQECEIRRRSEVRVADGAVVGHVDGFLVENVDIVGVIVRGRLPVLRENLVVSIGSVINVTNDMIELDLDEQEFRDLPAAEGLTNPHGEPSPTQSLNKELLRVPLTMGRRIQHLAKRGTRRLARSVTARR